MDHSMGAFIEHMLMRNNLNHDNDHLRLDPRLNDMTVSVVLGRGPLIPVFLNARVRVSDPVGTDVKLEIYTLRDSCSILDGVDALHITTRSARQPACTMTE
jgi:hypothetical protein